MKDLGDIDVPPEGKIQPRVRCPYCSRELAQGYLWLHRERYCPMRPSVQEDVKKEAMGVDIHGNDVSGIKSPGGTVPGSSSVGQRMDTGKTCSSTTGLMSGAIREIDLKEEYKMATTKVNPKKEQDDYECGACGGKFTEKLKHCPHCGVELE